MVPADLIALAERCVCEEPSRDLDADIAKAIGWLQFAGDNWIGPHGEIFVAAYTISLDAAVTLVPEGAEYSISTLYGKCSVEMPLNSSTTWHHAGRLDGNVPMTLCAAALRARAAMAADAPPPDLG